MAALISDNYPLLQVMSRFGIPLGISDKSIGEVCSENGVDTTTFLAVANLMLHQRNRAYKIDFEGLSLSDLMKYIRNSHIFYLNFRLPNIRKSLIEALGESDMAHLIVRYFDDYVTHIKEHLRYEEERLFPYINRLLCGERDDEFSVDLFSDKHDHIDEPLTEFKNVIIKYYSGESSYEIMSVIHDLLSCAADLLTHNMVEDRLLVPVIRKMEETK
ncbi:MAG: hemerythrin domain-containing protein [Rikenellaceae bacterium]